MLIDFEKIEAFYSSYSQNIEKVRKVFNRPLTYSEKILGSHLFQINNLQKMPKKGEDYALFLPDRVAMQDATAQMALLQFSSSGIQSVQVPTSLHCDHLILAELGAKKDLERAEKESFEVFQFLESVSKKYGIGFWRPGAGIIHQVVLENYAFPGGFMIGTDSHTPNAGGLGMLAIGVGGSDAVDVMAGMPWELKMPKVIGVHLTGSLQGWSSAKDVILKVASILTVQGGTGYIIEYFGEGAKTISATGKGTICNMGAEVGATTSLFPYDEKMGEYLRATGREKVALMAEKVSQDLRMDREVEGNKEAFFDQLIEINLTDLKPHVNGPYTPDLAFSIHELKHAVQKKGFPEKIAVALIGSCTNSSYEDMERAASVAKDALKKGLKAKCPLTITPGSELIHRTMKETGLLDPLEAIGGIVLANACGPCIGQWKRHDVVFGEKNSILTSYNRNFSGRNDANPATHSFVASPEIVVALSLAGNLLFDPLEDTLENEKGEHVFLEPPHGLELPIGGFKEKAEGFIPPKKGGEPEREILISPESERLQLLAPFNKPDLNLFKKVFLLAKCEGKCTTDHISPAGKWLKYRGHLDKISDNLLMGGKNKFRDLVGEGVDPFTLKTAPFSKIAREGKEKGLAWLIVGEENYGEGSSREHAAMEPRFLGGVAVIVKSFARIHETNLKKQGVLALTFLHPKDYDKIQEGDLFSFPYLEKMEPHKPLLTEVTHLNGEKEEILLAHTYSKEQIEWFWAGSALNFLREKLKN